MTHRGVIVKQICLFTLTLGIMQLQLQVVSHGFSQKPLSYNTHLIIWNAENYMLTNTCINSWIIKSALWCDVSAAIAVHLNWNKRHNTFIIPDRVVSVLVAFKLSCNQYSILGFWLYSYAAEFDNINICQMETGTCRKMSPNLTHWGRVTHICAGNLAIICSDNGLPPGRRQAIIQTNAVIL